MGVKAGLNSDRNPERLEDQARTALNMLAGRTLTDVEWTQGRARLLEFVKMLYAWDRQIAPSKSEIGNVVVISRRGP